MRTLSPPQLEKQQQPSNGEDAHSRMLYLFEPYYLEMQRTSKWVSAIRSPVAEVIRAEHVPEPARLLLCHSRNMTPTLSEHWGGLRVDLDVLWSSQMVEATTSLTRVVRLCVLDKVVEFAAIKIYLSSIPKELHSAILSGSKPLGTILVESGIAQRCSPHAFLKLSSDACIQAIFGMSAPAEIYGRCNEIRSPTGSFIAEVIELIPPLSTLAEANHCSSSHTN